MTGAPLIHHLSEIADAYDALLCDAWGVIHNGKTLLPGAQDALRRFRAARGPVVVLTNAPKPSGVIPAQLDRLGLARDAWDDIVTSGDATRAEIAALGAAPAYRIGPAFDDPLFEGLDVNFAPLEDAEAIICTGLNDGFTETPDHYRDGLRDAAARGLPMICANPDIQVNWGGRLMWCAGALAQIYQSHGGAVIFGGKPHAPIYRLARQRLASAGLAPGAAILAIGDGLHTDILGANKAGVDAVLVAGHGGLLEGASEKGAVDQALHDHDLRIVALMDGLRW